MQRVVLLSFVRVAAIQIWPWDMKAQKWRKRFNESGIAAFVLKYRIPDDSTMVNKEIGPLQDAQRAMQVLRMRSGEWGINPKPDWHNGFFSRRTSGIYGWYPFR